MIYKFGKIYLENEIVTNGFVEVIDGKISQILTKYDGEYADYSMYEVLPGIIDIHSHGCMGYSATTTNPEEVYGYTKAISSTGVTGVFATTQEFETMSTVADVIDSNVVKGARILGIHAEGPYRHPKYMGASKGFVWPKPSIEYTEQMIKAAKGHLKYMSVSTDLEGVYDVMPCLLENGIRVANGHTDVDFEQMNYALRNGITSISHFANAMRPIHQRNGGGIVSCLLDKNVKLELICDHIHICREMLDLFFRVKSLEDFVLISDSSELAYMPEGRYFARGKERIVTKDGTILIDDGTLSGSGKSIIHNMRILRTKHNLPLLDIIKMASVNPAKYFNLYDKKGSIAVGKDADLLIVDSQWNVVKTIVEGVVQYDKDVDVEIYNKNMKNLLKQD